MAAQDADPFAQYKAAQREAWASFLPVEVITTIPAAKLVKFAQVSSGQKVLDVACGAGVVAVTAARRGAIVSGSIYRRSCSSVRATMPSSRA
jgi:2-polyprenyl-3-methyl-5-hydroxy-6-metoxy-1,4-benzoquinol methylase